MSLSTPCSTTMKVAGLTPFQSFLLRPADIRSVIVFIAACIGTFFLLLHVKKLTDTAFPNEHHSLSHPMSSLSISPELPSTPTSVPTTLHMLMNMTQNDDGIVLNPLPSSLSSYQLLSLHALTASSQSHHYHMHMSELLVILHGSLELRIIDVHDGHIEDIMIHVDENNHQPMGILIHPYACHTFQSINNHTPHLVSYYLRDTSSNTITSDLKLILSDRHICPHTDTRTYTLKSTF